jgi:hypothetical protein
LRGGFSYILALTKFSLVSCVRFASQLLVSILSRPAAPALDFDTIATKFRAPFARFVAASPADSAKNLSALIASLVRADAAFFQSFLLLWGESHVTSLAPRLVLEEQALQEPNQPQSFPA